MIKRSPGQAQPQKKAATAPAPAKPVRRRKTISPRILVGWTLVAGSVAGVWWVVTETNHLRPYLVTVSEVAAGTPVGDVSFEVVYLASPGSTLDYLTPDTIGAVSTHTLDHALPAGSLVNVASVSEPVPDDTTTFTTTLAIGGAPWLQPGARVEVWVAAPLADQGYSVPTVVSPAALITGVRVDEGFAADASQVTVDLRVHHREVAKLIHASANDYSIQVSPVTGGRS